VVFDNENVFHGLQWAGVKYSGFITFSSTLLCGLPSNDQSCSSKITQGLCEVNRSSAKDQVYSKRRLDLTETVVRKLTLAYLGQRKSVKRDAAAIQVRRIQGFFGFDVVSFNRHKKFFDKSFNDKSISYEYVFKLLKFRN
jgi:hypothetical protein